MNLSIVLGLLQNIAILLSFGILFDYAWAKNEEQKRVLFKVLAGIIIGGFSLILMLTPWTLVPGLVFDTRSVLLSLSGLFFGPLTTLIAVAISGLYRLHLGGDGMWMGLSVITSAGILGIIWRLARPRWREKRPALELLALGVIVHITMLACTVFLPTRVFLSTFKTIFLPVIILYPIGTMLLGNFMLNRSISRQRKRDLEISEERWHFALEGAGDGVWDWNPQTNEVYFSRQWKAMLGYDETDIGNSLEDWKNLLHPDEKESVYLKIEEYFSGKEGAYSCEQRLLCKDGTYKWILDRGKIMERDKNGRIIRVIGTHTDISIQKKTEEEIKKLSGELEARVIERTAELEKATRELSENQGVLVNLVKELHEKSEQLSQRTIQLESANKELEAFSYSISHDLRAPLRAISGYVNFLKENLEEDLSAENQGLIRDILKSTAKMSLLIDDLLQFSRLSRKDLTKKTVNMDFLISTAVEEIINQSDLGKVQFNRTELPEAWGDPSLLKQVILNLVSNAVKFSSGKDQPVITIGGKTAPEENIYFIADNGVGFDTKYMHKLFKVFQRLHSQAEYEGSGVGLAIVSQIISRHGGKVWAESELNKGSTFYFSLPKNLLSF